MNEYYFFYFSGVAQNRNTRIKVIKKRDFIINNKHHFYTYLIKKINPPPLESVLMNISPPIIFSFDLRLDQKNSIVSLSHS